MSPEIEIKNATTSRAVIEMLVRFYESELPVDATKFIFEELAPKVEEAIGREFK